MILNKINRTYFINGGRRKEIKRYMGSSRRLDTVSAELYKAQFKEPRKDRVPLPKNCMGVIGPNRSSRSKSNHTNFMKMFCHR